jgi:hypothetical protein
MRVETDDILPMSDEGIAASGVWAIAIPSDSDGERVFPQKELNPNQGVRAFLTPWRKQDETFDSYHVRRTTGSDSGFRAKSASSTRPE